MVIGPIYFLLINERRHKVILVLVVVAAEAATDGSDLEIRKIADKL